MAKALARSAPRLVRDLVRDPAGFRLAATIRRRKLTYLRMPGLLDLRERVRDADAEGRPGVILEAGVALGGSAVMLACSKSTGRALHLYDVFGTIPPPSERDAADVHKRYQTITAGTSKGIGGETYYGYREDLQEHVLNTLGAFGTPASEHNIHLHKGLYEDTLNPPPVAVAHIDADWYDSVRTCLERIWPQLSPGGVVVVDDYDDWSGCRDAVDDWLGARSDVILERRTRIHLVKQR